MLNVQVQVEGLEYFLLLLMEIWWLVSETSVCPSTSYMWDVIGEFPEILLARQES